MYYIQETDKPSFWLRFFNIIKLHDNKIILPIRNENIDEKKQKKLARKTKKILDKTNCKKIVISNMIKQHKDYINYLHTYKYEINDGQWLFEVISNKVLDYIVQKKNIKKEETTISILVNNLTENMLENIKIIVKEYKRVNIITNYIEKFKKIEEKIFKEEGIMITITNNKRKSLSKSKIILNVDFPSEIINNYNINDEAIIINLKRNVKIYKKRFNGININDYEIEFDDKEKTDYNEKNKYKMAEIYEAKLYKKMPFSNIMERIEKDKVRIIQLNGTNYQI